MVERNTHLLDWLQDGHTHCQHGTKEWCEAYLHNARSVIMAQDAEIARLRGREEEYRKALEEAQEALRVIATGSGYEWSETREQLHRIIDAAVECASNALAATPSGVKSQ
jgi:hypothetical protein